MGRWLLVLSAFVGLTLPALRADPANPAPGEEKKGTYLGVLFRTVPDAVYAQVPELPHDAGVLVSFVLPDSPAAKAGIRRYDILLEYDGEAIPDCDHFARKLCDDKPERKVKFLLMRGGKKLALEATLTLGPALKIVPAASAAHDGSDPLKGAVKSNGPNSVRLSAQPLERDQIKVTIEYRDEKTGQAQTVTCTGKPDEIDSEIRKLPNHIQPLARAGLKRIIEPEKR